MLSWCCYHGACTIFTFNPIPVDDTLLYDKRFELAEDIFVYVVTWIEFFKMLK